MPAKRKRRTIKFKPMVQILQENAEAYFNDAGFLIRGINRNENSLNPCYFCYLGKTMTFTHNLSFHAWIVDKITNHY